MPCSFGTIFKSSPSSMQISMHFGQILLSSLLDHSKGFWILDAFTPVALACCFQISLPKSLLISACHPTLQPIPTAPCCIWHQNRNVSVRHNLTPPSLVSSTPLHLVHSVLCTSGPTSPPSPISVVTPKLLYPNPTHSSRLSSYSTFFLKPPIFQFSFLRNVYYTLSLYLTI